MSSVVGFLRQDFLTQTSYRLQTLLSIAGILIMMVPVYFIAQALQPTMAESIQDQGQQYFGFLVVGFAAQRVLLATVRSLPTAVHSGIRTGTLEALFATPTSVPALISGMMGYKILWSFVEAAALLGTGWILGARLAPDHVFAGLVIAILIALAYLPFALISAAGILAFRTSGPLISGVLVSSMFLGGVYYPTEVIPSWIEHLSAVIPLTYGLRALRLTLLEGMPIGAVSEDLLVLALFILLLGTVAVFLFGRALLYARRSGSLAQY